VKRRNFLLGAGAGLGSLALGPSLLGRLAHSDPRRAPTRLLIIHKPAGIVPAAYDCTGVDRDFTLSHILEPYAALREHMVLLDGLEIPKATNTPGEDHGNAIVTFMTGGVPYRPEGTNVPLAERISIDQMFAASQLAGDTPIRSLQLTADDRALQFFVRVLSYAGRGQPLPPEQDPGAVFSRVFGSLNGVARSPAELASVRAKKQSVLDFARRDLGTLRGRVGSEGRERLDRHLQAIREVEQVVHRTVAYDTSRLRGQLSAVDAAKRDEQHAALGRAHLDVVRAAFQCDLTRVASFQWGSMEANMSRVIPGARDIGYHLLSHYAGNVAVDADLTLINRWYSERLAEYLVTLRDTPDVDGNSLLDNMLVVVWSEMRLGSHSFDNVPIQLFGGAGGRLAGGRLLRYTGHTSNDLWLTIANVLGLRIDQYGDAERNKGLLPGLFDDALLPASLSGNSRER